jgi:ketosteroid isomerase-like protein
MNDPIPATLLSYYEALDAGRMGVAADCFAVDCRYAVPGPGSETDARIETNGRPALLSRFETRGLLPRRHQVELCLAEGRHCLVEGTVVDTDSGTPASTFVASITLGDDGLIERYLAFTCDGAREPVDRTATLEQPTVALEVLHDYFDALDTGRFEAAADCFSPDVLYSHPPYKHTGITTPGRVEFRGRAELLDAFRRRGRQSFGHVITVCIQRGPHAILEGAVHDLPDGRSGSFISSLTLDGTGRIRRYVSFYCEPAIAP